MAIDNPTGATATFSSTGLTVKITGFTFDGEEVPVIDVTHLSTTAYREKIFGTLKEPGAVEFNFLYDPDAGDRPALGTVETLTVTFPTALGTGEKLAGTGALTAWNLDAAGGDESAINGSFTFSFDGQTGPTWTNAIV